MTLMLCATTSCSSLAMRRRSWATALLAASSWSLTAYLRRWRTGGLRRPSALYVRARDSRERLVERAEFGESQPDPELHNLRGRLYRQYDEAGILTTSPVWSKNQATRE